MLDQVNLKKIKRRKGARKVSEVPEVVLAALNNGWISTVNLTEWLAVDMAFLLRQVLVEIGLEEYVAELGCAADKLAKVGVTKRVEGIGKLLYDVIHRHANHDQIFYQLATHESDVVRQWANYLIAADQSLDLSERLERTRRFAADSHFGVRECAWMSFRPYLMVELERGLRLLERWVDDSDPNIRRFGVEVTRPVGVWSKHISVLKNKPQLGLVLLEKVRSDHSRYVQRSVSNWLNDASKYSPDWVLMVCRRWQTESPSKETKWIINHALRTLRKKGHNIM